MRVPFRHTALSSYGTIWTAPSCGASRRGAGSCSPVRAARQCWHQTRSTWIGSRTGCVIFPWSAPKGSALSRLDHSRTGCCEGNAHDRSVAGQWDITGAVGFLEAQCCFTARQHWRSVVAGRLSRRRRRRARHQSDQGQSSAVAQCRSIAFAISRNVRRRHGKRAMAARLSPRTARSATPSHGAWLRRRTSFLKKSLRPAVTWRSYGCRARFAGRTCAKFQIENCWSDKIPCHCEWLCSQIEFVIFTRAVLRQTPCLLLALREAGLPHLLPAAPNRSMDGFSAFCRLRRGLGGRAGCPGSTIRSGHDFTNVAGDIDIFSAAVDPLAPMRCADR